MKGDYSRLTYDPARRFTSLLLQQGRVVSDADWNEAAAIAGGRIETTSAETIGPTGAPKTDPGFGITPSGGDLLIGRGRYWVDGILCINPADTLYSAQTDYPAAALPPAGGIGLYVVYLDVWQRHLTALDDAGIREPALGGPDTATRLRTVAQVRLMRVADADPAAMCETTLPLWQAVLDQAKGTLTARLGPTASNPDPCELPPGAQFRGLENQLYRVEVHTGADTLANARFKWSRDNGHVVSAITSFDATGIVVTDLGPDDVLGFAPGQWAEIIDDHSELLRTPGQLVELGVINPDTRRIEIVGPFTAVPADRRPKLRRWDQRGTAATSAGVAAAQLAPSAPDLGLVLEDGIEVVLAEGTYREGDHWLVPARTAISAETGTILWPRDPVTDAPLPAPPHGIHHHHAPLAVVSFDGVNFLPVDPPDCRRFFPTLTTLTASDVAFDDASCALGGVETVQDAIDALCRVNLGDELRLHNRMLHGYGVVCGLKVVCSANRTRVAVEAGYALDCDGNGVSVAQAVEVDVIGAAATQGLLDNAGNGKVLVAMGRDPAGGAPVLSVEPYQSQTFWEEVLEGTLIKDYYENAIQGLLNFLRNELFPLATSGVPVPERNRRFAAVLNLIIQLINPSSGRYVFLSEEEDQLLRGFYQRLKALIASETFCAMFDNDAPFPAYPYPPPPGIRTGFGLFRFHHRIRVHPTQPWAYTCGTGNAINVFDITTGEMIADLVFPANAQLDVQDVAVSEDGETLHAVALLQGAAPQDSIFAQASIAGDGTHTWSPQTTNVCDFVFIRLAVSPQRPGRLFALAASRGLYDFDPDAIPPVPGAAVPSFNATGMLTLSDDGQFAFAAENALIAVGVQTPTFTRVRRIDLTNAAAAPVFCTVGGTDMHHDVLEHAGTLWVTGDPAPGHTRSLWSFVSATGAAQHPPVDLQLSSWFRLAAVPAQNALLVTVADRYLARRHQLDNGAPVANFRVPLQISPIDIATAPDGRTVCAANMFSSTVSLIDAAVVLASTPLPSYTDEPPLTLLAYRDGIIAAFSDLLQHLLFYLKDKFCDQFLIDCPTCGPDERVILGVVEIRTRQVYNICNLTKRRYVKSFNTYGYWLSAVPILPLAKRLFAKFCCWVF
ncbi:MAG: DUF4815 domain-containing protein [Gemmatimonadetes bacterium]|nr:DUF4815 domain-containing protein [Gemmatimonadota bacterium]